MSALGICVNPMSGRDVRRLAARATNMTHEAKMDIVARIAIGADNGGIDELFITKEPFRIAERAVAWLPLNARVNCLPIELHHDASDTQRAIRTFREHGVSTVVALGGDGTHRAIAKADSDLQLIPLSTGTNNVFPIAAEPTIAGLVGAYAARGMLSNAAIAARAKTLSIKFPERDQDTGLIDVALLENDFVGNFRPIEAEKMKKLVLTRALPDAIGNSPIGGLVRIVEAEDDFGLDLDLGSGPCIRAPIAPGLFADVQIEKFDTVAFGQGVELQGPGVIAIDGDRVSTLAPEETAEVSIARDGPWVIDVAKATREWVNGCNNVPVKGFDLS